MSFIDYRFCAFIQIGSSIDRYNHSHENIIVNIWMALFSGNSILLSIGIWLSYDLSKAKFTAFMLYIARRW